MTIPVFYSIIILLVNIMLIKMYKWRNKIMNFLKADCVRIRRHYKDRVEETKTYTTRDAEQQLYVDLTRKKGVQRYEVIICYNGKNPAPKTVSISANQYTMKPFDIEISLYKRYAKNPYSKFNMGTLRSLFDIEEGTNKIVLEFIKPEGDGHFAEVKLIANYAKF